MKAGRLTCRALVEQYLRRIDAFDKNGPAINAIVITNPEAIEAGRRDGSALQAGRTLRPAPLHPDHRQGQLRDDWAAERQRLARARRVCLQQGRVPGQEDQGGRRDRHREVEHGGVGVQSARDGQLDPAGLHEESVRARSRHRGIERRHRGRRGGQLRHRRARQRHRQLDSRAVIAPGARRHSFDDGTDEPRGRDAAEPAGRHRGTDGANRRRRRHGVPGDRRQRSRRSGRPPRPPRTCRRTTRRRSCATA